jgi:hypothetical protein
MKPAPKLNLSVVPGFLRRKARKALAAGDYAGFLYTTDSTLYPRLIGPNLQTLRRTAFFEPMLVEAWVMTRSDNGAHFDFCENAFRYADRAALLAAGDPLPSLPLPMYRGVSGADACDIAEPFGYSWTADFEKAKWFAGRWQRQSQAVFMAEVSEPDKVLFYTNMRNEQEFVLDPLTAAQLDHEQVWTGGTQ